MSKKLLMNTNVGEQGNYRRYYQEYEGTFITATDKSEDDTIDTSRFIEVAEIWGNTVQDENNLEDIQSIGELYVNEDGEPILDDLGREQYKIEIESCNKNLSNINYVIGYIDANHPLDTDFRFSISLSDLTEYIPPQSNKTTILLPCQLQKVGDVYDRLYWDSEKGKYVVEKNINSRSLSDDAKDLSLKIAFYARKTMAILYSDLANTVYNGVLVFNSLANKFKSYNDKIMNAGFYGIKYDLNGYLYMDCGDYIPNTQPNTFRQFLLDNDINWYYSLKEPQLIETSITEKILLPCYEEKTHIFVNSTVDATMKVLVPYKEII